MSPEHTQGTYQPDDIGNRTVLGMAIVRSVEIVIVIRQDEKFQNEQKEATKCQYVWRDPHRIELDNQYSQDIT